ncbi:bacterioferritin [Alkalilimnicola ehrlichii]|uniref:Bacterioferritin n=1 Tax=Alkalilimnicola ehrlichii TaxID=351052 RepID=A0A3E0WRK5_9GAMM|nr:bacterioferritin [Alkalilimnicola ehrlichii]RFA27969.1 bacterioferritin [Alkalilimnicola ehrlichii]RFA34616.1 bacterioferritin [Alkalilimnicola ehrlichii]
MQGDPKLIEMLNRLLAGELAAIDQYFVHSRMYEDWGLQKLYERIEHEREDEVGHADRLIKRILFLGGTPDLSQREPLNIGKDVPEMLRSDLELEYAVVKALKDVIAYAEQIGDYVTRDMLVELLDDTEEDHAHWLEQQLALIKRLGLENYQQSQL